MVLKAAFRLHGHLKKNSSVLLCYATQASMKFAQLFVCPANVERTGCAAFIVLRDRAALTRVSEP